LLAASASPAVMSVEKVMIASLTLETTKPVPIGVAPQDEDDII
jgi:hypothetical protein